MGTGSKNLAVGTAATADFISLGHVSSTTARVRTFLSTEGSFSERAEAANTAGFEARANVMSLGFYGAEDKGEHAMQITGLAGVREGAQQMGAAIAEGDVEGFALGFSEALGGGSQFSLLVAGSYRGLRTRSPGGTSPEPAPPAMTNAELVQEVATRAERAVPGSGGRIGTLRHSYADRLLMRYQRLFGDRGLDTEVPYRAGMPGQRGRGSIRLDVVEGDRRSPVAIYDYKFGTARLTDRRIQQIRTVGNFSDDVPVIEVKP